MTGNNRLISHNQGMSKMYIHNTVHMYILYIISMSQLKLKNLSKELVYALRRRREHATDSVIIVH